MADSTQKQPQLPQRPPEPGGMRMVLTMGGIGLMCGILIVGAFELTFPTIKRKKAEALDRAILQVVPGATSKVVFKLTGAKLVPSTVEDEAGSKYYACYEGGRLKGIAIEAAGQGFQDIVRVIYGYSPGTQSIIGLKVLESKETPGLGTKIETDPEFRANFRALEVVFDSDKRIISDPIVLVKPGAKTQPWQIEAISGATISSQAIATLLHRSTAVTVPVIFDNLSTLEEPPE